MLVRQVENVLDLLEFFADRGSSASLAEVSQHFGWPRSSAYNLLSTLNARGYLYEPSVRGRYYPTPRWYAIAEQVSAAEPVPEDLVRLGRTLRDLTGETVCIGAAAGLSVVFLEVVSSPVRVRYAAEVGQRIPIHATASGWSILSQWSAVRRASLLRKVEFERYGSGSPMSVDAVEDRIRSGLHNGWFGSASSFSVDLGGVSIPLVVAERVYSFTVAGPLNRIEENIPRIAGQVHEAVSQSFGADYLSTMVPNLRTPPNSAA
ncbi:MAG: helix-turn-helix domain-containing protein [Roseovarius sp.]|nr:helix-turn-helix domain-containing protein [Roseovarius sp.]